MSSSRDMEDAGKEESQGSSHDLRDKAQEVGDRMKEGAKDVGSRVGEVAEKAKDYIKDSMKSTKKYKMDMSSSGETHQVASSRDDTMTTNIGIPISDNQNTLKSGAHGPALLEDFMLREKVFHFDHERIPERVVHARGTAAHGYFELYESLSDITIADMFQRAGEKTPVFVRFSTVSGSLGSVDTPRDVRGFATKFYTKQGNWDLVGNNIPVFFIQDAIKFPDLVHAVKPEADKAIPQAATAHDTFWDFISLMPESSNMVMWIMSDRTLPRSFRHMEGFGVHTFQFINSEGRSTLVKFHWKPKLGLQSTVWDEALKLQCANNDFHRVDLWESIENGEYPEWEMGVQLFDEELANSLPYDVLDPTKYIPEEVVPIKIVGRLVLDRNVDNFFAETEQVAYCPANIVPGIDFTNDPLLQGRLFSYLDTQKSRLGTVNFHHLPINAPKCPFMNFNRDGMMQTKVFKGRANYEPNSLGEVGEVSGPRECPKTGFKTYPNVFNPDAKGGRLRVRPAAFADHYSQARQFYESQTENEKAHIASALVFELSKVKIPHIPLRVLANIRNINEDLAKRVADKLGVELPEKAKSAAPVIDLPPSPGLSIQRNMKPIIKGRCVGLLIADGSDATTLAELKTLVTAEGGRVILVGPKAHGIKLSNGTSLDVDGQLLGTPSPLFDAVGVLLSEAGVNMLINEAAAIEWVSMAYSHLKAIGCNEEAKPLLRKANVIEDEGVTDLGQSFLKAGVMRFFDREPKLRMLA